MCSNVFLWMFSVLSSCDPAVKLVPGGYSVTPEELTIVRVNSLLFQREIILIFIIQDYDYQNITISYFKDCLNCKQHADMTTCVHAV